MNLTMNLIILKRVKVIFLVLWALSPFIGISQTTPELPFPLYNPLNPSQNLPQSFDLGDPTNLQQGIVYDPESGGYIYTETIGNGLYYRSPSIMSLQEYIDLENKKSMQMDWQEIIEEEISENRQLELPIKVGSKLFENFFGSDEIKITPGGNIEVSLGANHSRVDNPMLPLRQRRITRFDFNQNINLDVTGQVGTKLKLTMRYNTAATFDFNNFSNIQHTGKEDEILQEIALGNVALDLPTSLIQGSQTLFGVKTQLKFGRATWDLIAAQSKGKRTEINVSGKAQVQEFELTADNYEQNRHYFLNLYHQQHYDTAMASLPVVNSTAYITRIEVWITNRNSSTENTRNVLAFADLGEALESNCQGSPGAYNISSILPDNESNGLYAWASNQPNVRGFANAVSTLSTQISSPGPFQQAIHYEKVENARKLNENEFTYNALLGYISLNNSYNNDEVLAVAYEYTYNGQTFQVGEFSTDGSSGQDALILKLLKPTITNPNNKVWDLMMKNVYSINAAQVDQEGFKIDILYNNPEQSVLIPFLPYDGVDTKQIVTILDMDKLNQNNQPFSDGVFDFVPMNIMQGNQIDNGGTINRKTGRIYFSTVEPFGKTLKNKLLDAGMASSIVNSIAFTELYDSTKTAAQQIPSKNRFSFKGQFQSSISSEISLGAFDIPEGAVVVTAGGIRLTEGIDYQVDYAMGRVKILNTSLLESNTQLKISIESNSMFGFQARSLIGGHYTYRFSENLKLGATWVRMTERPVTQKVDFGSEPFKNNVIGADFSWRTNVPFLTKLVDLLPVVSTKQMSTLSLQGEVATLIPGQPRAINKEGTSYLDDFEAAQSSIDLRSINSWRLASIPQGQPDLFPEAQKNKLSAGYKRSKVAWYTIDPVFVQGNSLTPDHIAQDGEMLADSRMRLLLITELFPNNQPQQGQMTNVATLDLAYYPKERGMYNYDTLGVDTTGRFLDPENRWGGISRALTTNDFEMANIEFIQFWLLDPFNVDAENQDSSSLHSGGDLYFNLGNVSEDVLPDSRKSFENGLPAFNDVSQESIDTTVWSRISSQQIVVNAFDNDPDARINQDVGLDGWNNEEERIQYSDFISWVNNSTLTAAAKSNLISDPSSDDYTYYLDDNYDQEQRNILERYKKYNGMEGNSPTTQMSDTANAQGYPTQATNIPDNEDINADNNLSETENYFQYKVQLKPNAMVEGSNYITNVQDVPVGNKVERWYQFKIPITDYERKVNGIQDFRSIRFMRMFLKNFDEEVVLRFARLELIRGEWRRYNLDLTQPGLSVQVDPNLTSFNIGAVNVEENAEREPIKYVVPPGIVREIDPSQVFQRQMNEQSLVLDICNLQDGDARAAYRNVNFDVRTYKKLKMFVHAEGISEFTNPLEDDDVTLFVRLGTDFAENYYEYELPLKVTDPGNASTAEQIWPEANNVEITFSDLIDLKKERNAKIEEGAPGVSYLNEYEDIDPQNGQRKIKVKGSPNLQGLKTIMVGVRNPLKNDPENIWQPDDGDAECLNVWINELRLTDFVSEGGSAAVGQMQLQLADFGNISASGNYSGINWGSVESRVQDRQRFEQIGVDMNSTFELGQFFGKKAQVSLPFFYGYSLGIINPEFDPFNPDIKLKDYDIATRKERSKLGQDFNERKSFNFTNVRKQQKPGSKASFWRISNWSTTYSFAQNLKRDFNTNYDITKTWNGSLNYNYTFSAKPWEPLKKWKPIKKNKYFALLRDFNLFLKPKNLSFNNDYARLYNERQVRNNIVPDFEFDPIYLKKFDWVRSYAVGYDLNKNLKATFNAVNRSIFEEGNHGIDRRNNPEGYQELMDTLRSQISTLGKTVDYSQDYTLSYNVPLDKFPLTDWIRLNAKYTGSYNWKRAPFGQAEFGNIIQNTRNVNLTSQANFVNLYRKVPLFKKVLSGGRTGRMNTSRRTIGGNKKGENDKNKNEKTFEELFKPDKPLDEMTKKERRKYERKKRKWERKKAREARREKNAKKEVHPAVKAGANLLMTVRNISGTYSVTDGTLLPGFSEETRILGMNNNTTGLSSFVFGRQAYNIWGTRTDYNIAERSTSNNWLVQNSNLNTQFAMNHTENLSLKATLMPFEDFNINVNVLRNYKIDESEFYRWNDLAQAFEGQNNFKRAQLTYTTLTIPSAFQKLDREYSSQSFQTLLDNRQLVSQLLGGQNTNSSILANNYYDGYSESQQDVIIGAFLATYTNRPINDRTINPVRNIPMPNWTLNYNGLSKLKFAKKVVRNFKLNHAYSSTIAVNGMQTNLNAQLDANGSAFARDINNNFISELQVQNVVVTERFSPLVGFLATWNILGKSITTNFEYKKERSTTLSLNNNQITENLSTSIVAGTVLTFPKMQLPFEGVKQSDLIVNINFNFQDNIVVVRKILENTNQATSGQKIVSFKLDANYKLTDFILASFYYEQRINTPKVQTSYPTGNLKTGLTIRYDLNGLK